MYFTVLFTAFLVALGATAEPNPSTPVTLKVFESVHQTPQGWTKLDEEPSASQRLRLRIALKEPDHDLFEATLFSVSDPDHASYGQHLKREEVKSLIKPKVESTEAVLSWLSDSGVPESDIENDGEWVNFYVSISKANAMLDTTFSYYTQDSDETHKKKIRALSYSVPSNVSPHIAMIQPTTRFGQMRADGKTSFIVSHKKRPFKGHHAPHVPSVQIDPSCNTTITPACLRAMYSIGDYKADPRVGSILGVAGFLEQIAKYDALEMFLDTYAPYAKKQNFTFVEINGGLTAQNDTVHDDTEANLDIQYAASLGFNEKMHYYSTGGRGPLVPDLDQPDPNNNANEPYLEFLTHMLKLHDDELPQTLTTSYGEDEQSVPESYARTVCNMYGQLGMRGVSVIFSSGDTGVGSACQTNDGRNITRFMPIFPAACPYVTSVGATRSYPEEAVFFSSGGFSDIHRRPSYQDQAVKRYLRTLGRQWKGLYNPEGRGFPDIAAQGFNFDIVGRRNPAKPLEVLQVGGTSASAPTIAAIFALLNNARLLEGRRPMGFLNPWLYSTGKNGLTDVVRGGSTGCNGISIYSGYKTPVVPYASWNATAGWDPVTGLGTPNFRKLLKLATHRDRLPHIKNCDDSLC